LRDTKSSIDLVHVEDVAGALVALTLKDGPSGVFNVGSGSATRVSDVVEFVRSVTANEEVGPKITDSTDELASWADITSMRVNFGWKPKILLTQGIRSIISEG
jgi:nucleoside-diphosphate-sugar epimerase